MADPAVALVVLVGTLILTPLLVWWLRRQDVLDRPNQRSSHGRATPRGGGIVVAVMSVVAIALAGGGIAWWVAVPAALLAVVGLADDLGEVVIGTRLTGQVVIAAGVVGGLALTLNISAWWAVFGLVWIVGYVNAFNFMDGINGVSAVHAAILGATWLVVSAMLDVPVGVTIGLVLAAAAVGFLPYNFPTARVFLGDVGSYFLGGWIAVGGVLLVSRIGVLPALLPTAVYVADTTWTLVGRLRRGESWKVPHRDHVYQRLVRDGWSHVASTSAVGLTTLALAALAVWVATMDGDWIRWLVVLIALIPIGVYLSLPAISQRSRGTDSMHSTAS